MSLSAAGWRFIYRPDRGWHWAHPADVKPEDIDGTDMSDADFEKAVKNLGGPPQ